MERKNNVALIGIDAVLRNRLKIVSAALNKSIKGLVESILTDWLVKNQEKAFGGDWLGLNKEETFLDKESNLKYISAQEEAYRQAAKEDEEEVGF